LLFESKVCFIISRLAKAEQTGDNFYNLVLPGGPMEPTVNAAVVQFNIALGDIEANLAKVEAGLARCSAKGAQLVVLPEMWSAGYDYKRLRQHADQTPFVESRIKTLSEELGLVIVGSLPEKQGDAIYNTATLFDSGSERGRYRKLHMFSTMGEDRFLMPGDQVLVADTSLGRIGVAICYDLRFPELFRKMAIDGAEIICLPAEWPKPRQEHWRTLLRARAIENQLFIAAANCCGPQGKLDFFGMSLLISSRGDLLAEGEEAATELIATFDSREMRDYREQIRCYHDRRP
jgi:predicted amidohydrolase